MNTSSKKLKILLCNDDGISAPGLRTLWEALHEANFADLSIIAPTIEKSGTGLSITLNRSILIREIPWDHNTKAWSIDGTPADCIKLGLSVLLKEKPDLIISGINAGSNAGRNVLHSGTAGAIIEGIFHEIPGIALSCEDWNQPNYSVAKRYVKNVVDYALAHPLPYGSFLNVNFPHVAPDQIKGFRLTRQGKGRWSEQPYLDLHTEHGPTYYMGSVHDGLEETEDCDIALLKKGYMTAVPIHVHELTDRSEIEKRKKSFEEFFNTCEKWPS